MNRDDIIRMARESNFYDGEIGVAEDCFVHFAALVAAAEREACAKLVEDKFDFCGDELTAAAAIRARSSQ